MCRFVLYLGRPIHLSSLLTEPENSLIRQSFDSRERDEPLNGDGFGVAWYAPDATSEAVVFRSITPAWSNQNLARLAGAIRSSCVLAHVRAASTGLAVTELNTHPFVFGPYAFMHNGELAGYHKHRRSILDALDGPYYDLIEGTTDSECLFAYALQYLERNESATGAQMAIALERSIGTLLAQLESHGVQSPSYVNAALSNGREAVVCRYTNARLDSAPSLHLHTGKLYTCRSGIPKLIEAHEDEHSVIVASESLTDDSSWRVVPANHIVIIDARRQIVLRGIDVGWSAAG